MSSELSIFAAQLREVISFQASEATYGIPSSDGPLSRHAESEFNGYSMVLFSLQFKSNEPYRKLCESRGITPETTTHWTQIPAVPTAAFKELEITCLPPEQRTHVFHSSGTTEQKPSRHFHNAESLATYEASLWPWFARHVVADSRLPIGDFRLAILTPPPSQVPHSSLVHMFETVRRKFIALESTYVARADEHGLWQLDFDSAISQLNSACRDNKPTLLLGTAFSFVHLLDTLNQMRLSFRLPPGSRVMETGGYKGRSRSLPKQELHEMITNLLGIPASHITCEYSMSELSSQAYDHAPATSDHSSLVTRSFHFPPWARAQMISPETGLEVADGETGLIRVFDLANVFSVMAVQTEDLGVRRGDEFELVGRAQLVEPRGCSLMVA